jgi:uncharacterized protein (TIGR03790 family)
MTRSLQLGFAMLTVLLTAGITDAAPSGDEVVVVFNKRMNGSEAVARHYAGVRKVPANQVIGFELGTGEEMSRVEYDGWLARPLAHELESRKLWRLGTVTRAVTNATDLRELRMPVESKIRYIVLCFGVPLKIKPDDSVKEEGVEQWQPELRRNEAAVDSELACLALPPELRKLTGLVRNSTYTTTNSAWLHPTNGLLMVARLDGPTAEIARGLVDLAVSAETNGFWGRAYCDIRSVEDSAYVQGDEWIRGAFDLCRVAGFESVLDTNGTTFPAGFPLSQVAFYAGWYDQHVSGPFTPAKVEFMPGAFAYHLHSSSAASLRTSSQFWAGPLLARGAACTMGSVYEPYLSGTPDIGVFTARWLLSNFSFGEAAYTAQQALSWQTTVVGDPLYRPFALHPQLMHLKLENAGNPLLAWSHLRVVNLHLVRGTPMMQMIGYLQGLEMTKTNAVMMEKLADLYLAVGKPESTVHAYRQALKSEPSPQQQLRLRLKLADQLMAQGREGEWLDNGLALLKEFPQRPGLLELNQQLLAIARKLERTEDATKLAAEVARLTPAIPTNAPAPKP